MSAVSSSRSGFGLVEIIIAVTIAVLLIIGFGQTVQLSLRLLGEERTRFEAALVLGEAVEGVRALRDESWARNIATLEDGRTYFLTATSTWGVWQTVQPNMDGRYERTIRVDAVNRETGTDKIVSSGGYSDPGTKKLMVVVSWRSRNATTSISDALYLTNFIQN